MAERERSGSAANSVPSPAAAEVAVARPATGGRPAGPSRPSGLPEVGAGGGLCVPCRAAAQCWNASPPTCPRPQKDTGSSLPACMRQGGNVSERSVVKKIFTY